MTKEEKREGASLIFKKWRDEETPVFCESLLFCGLDFKFLRGFVEAVELNDDVRIRSNDGSVSLMVRLRDAEDFAYAESKDSPEPLGSMRPITNLVTVIMPLREHAPRPERLFVAELPS